MKLVLLLCTLLAQPNDEDLPIIRDSGKPGPTILLTAGAGQSAATLAARQISAWPLQQGRLICMPVISTDATPDGSHPADTLQQLLMSHRPDWLIELRESDGFASVDPKQYGSTIRPGDFTESSAVVASLISLVNLEIDEATRKFTESKSAPADSLTAAISEKTAAHPSIRTLLITTARSEQSTAVRARQLRRVTAALLQQLSVLHSTDAVTELLVTTDQRPQFNIALLDDRGVAGKGIPSLLEIWGSQPDVTVHRVCGADIRSGCLTQFDLLCCSGGSGSRQSASLGDDGRQAIRKFVDQGGDYVGICAGSYLACSGFSWGLGILDAKTKSSKWARGHAELPLTLTTDGQRILADGLASNSIIYHNGPIIEPHHQPEIPDFQVLATFAAEVAKNNTPVGIMINSPAIVKSQFGSGDVVCISPHPEQSGPHGRQWVIDTLQYMRRETTANKNKSRRSE